MRWLIVMTLMGAAACGPRVEPSCRVLQDYYDDCCFTCGARDSYCSSDYYVEDLTEQSCRSELSEWDLDECICDE